MELKTHLLRLSKDFIVGKIMQQKTYGKFAQAIFSFALFKEV